MKRICNVPAHQHLPKTWSKTFPMDCPKGCGKKIFYFQCGHGSKVFFEKLGGGFPKHFINGECRNSMSREEPPRVTPEPTVQPPPVAPESANPQPPPVRAIGVILPPNYRNT